MIAAIKALEPIERSDTLSESVEKHLRELLISGRLAPGEKLSLRTVADALGVSMMPAREAVSRLIAEEALEVLPNRAVRVPVMSLAHFQEMTKIRIHVEGYAAAKAARNATKLELQRIGRHEAAFRAECDSPNPDLSKVVFLNKELHFETYAAARMPILVQIIRRLWLQAGPVLNLDLRESPLRVKEGTARIFHAELLAALKRNDAEAAAEAIANDIRTAAQIIESRGILK